MFLKKIQSGLRKQLRNCIIDIDGIVVHMLNYTKQAVETIVQNRGIQHHVIADTGSIERRIERSDTPSIQGP